MLHRIEGENGARVWASVRRSGKSTACQDLGHSIGGSLIISQSCESTDPEPEKTHIFTEILHALESGSRLKGEFFETQIRRLVRGTFYRGQKKILLLDEYETLLENLRIALKQDPDLRYLVAQPLLSQMTSFAAQNLLIFVGQRPDAHFIIMDQNQLSPYVVQDTFPLFKHAGEANSEFSVLVEKVLTERVDFTMGFVDQIFRLTNGHPFLSVNVLTDYCDWAIEKRLPLTRESFADESAKAFVAERLVREKLKASPNYEFFRRMARHSLSPEAKKSVPWIYVAGELLRFCGSEGTDGLWRVSLDDFRRTYSDLDGSLLLDMEADEFLNGAEAANFFVRTPDNSVGPMIPILSAIYGLVDVRR